MHKLIHSRASWWTDEEYDFSRLWNSTQCWWLAWSGKGISLYLPIIAPVLSNKDWTSNFFFYFRVSTHWQTEIGNLFPSWVSHAFSHPFIARAYIFKKPTPRETGKKPVRTRSETITRSQVLSVADINWAMNLSITFLFSSFDIGRKCAVPNLIILVILSLN